MDLLEDLCRAVQPGSPGAPSSSVKPRDVCRSGKVEDGNQEETSRRRPIRLIDRGDFGEGGLRRKM